MERRMDPNPKREEEHREHGRTDRESGRHDPADKGGRPEETPRKFGERRDKPQPGRRDGGSSR
jgi:hypothetical protein